MSEMIPHLTHHARIPATRRLRLACSKHRHVGRGQVNPKHSSNATLLPTEAAVSRHLLPHLKVTTSYGDAERTPGVSDEKKT